MSEESFDIKSAIDITGAGNTEKMLQLVIDKLEELKNVLIEIREKP